MEKYILFNLYHFSLISLFLWIGQICLCFLLLLTLIWANPKYFGVLLILSWSHLKLSWKSSLSSILAHESLSLDWCAHYWNALNFVHCRHLTWKFWWKINCISTGIMKLSWHCTKISSNSLVSNKILLTYIRKVPVMTKVLMCKLLLKRSLSSSETSSLLSSLDMCWVGLWIWSRTLSRIHVTIVPYSGFFTWMLSSLLFWWFCWNWIWRITLFLIIYFIYRYVIIVLLCKLSRVVQRITSTNSFKSTII